MPSSVNEVGEEINLDDEDDDRRLVNDASSADAVVAANNSVTDDDVDGVLLSSMMDVSSLSLLPSSTCCNRRSSASAPSPSCWLSAQTRIATNQCCINEKCNLNHLQHRHHDYKLCRRRRDSSSHILNLNKTMDFIDEREEENKGDDFDHADDDADSIRDDPNDNLLDHLTELQGLHRRAERMKILGNKHMDAKEYTRAYIAYSLAYQLAYSSGGSCDVGNNTNDSRLSSSYASLGVYSHVYLCHRVLSLLMMGRYHAAHRDAKHATSIAPHCPTSYLRLGQSLFLTKQYGPSITAFDDAVQRCLAQRQRRLRQPSIPAKPEPRFQPNSDDNDLVNDDDGVDRVTCNDEFILSTAQKWRTKARLRFLDQQRVMQEIYEQQQALRQHHERQQDRRRRQQEQEKQERQEQRMMMMDIDLDDNSSIGKLKKKVEDLVVALAGCEDDRNGGPLVGMDAVYVGHHNDVIGSFRDDEDYFEHGSNESTASGTMKSQTTNTTETETIDKTSEQQPIGGGAAGFHRRRDNGRHHNQRQNRTLSRKTQNLQRHHSTLHQQSETSSRRWVDNAILIQGKAQSHLENREYQLSIDQFTAALSLVATNHNDEDLHDYGCRDRNGSYQEEGGGGHAMGDGVAEGGSQLRVNVGFELASEILLGRSHAHSCLGQYNRARDDAISAVRLHPSCPKAKLSLAKCLHLTKDYHGAVDAFYDCVERLPADTSASSRSLGEQNGMSNQHKQQKHSEERARCHKSSLLLSLASSSSLSPCTTTSSSSAGSCGSSECTSSIAVGGDDTDVNVDSHQSSEARLRGGPNLGTSTSFSLLEQAKSTLEQARSVMARRALCGHRRGRDVKKMLFASPSSFPPFPTALADEGAASSHRASVELSSDGWRSSPFPASVATKAQTTAAGWEGGIDTALSEGDTTGAINYRSRFSGYRRGEEEAALIGSEDEDKCKGVRDHHHHHPYSYLRLCRQLVCRSVVNLEGPGPEAFSIPQGRSGGPQREQPMHPNHPSEDSPPKEPTQHEQQRSQKKNKEAEEEAEWKMRWAGGATASDPEATTGDAKVVDDVEPFRCEFERLYEICDDMDGTFPSQPTPRSATTLSSSKSSPQHSSLCEKDDIVPSKTSSDKIATTRHCQNNVIRRGKYRLQQQQEQKHNEDPKRGPWLLLDAMNDDDPVAHDDTVRFLEAARETEKVIGSSTISDPLPTYLSIAYSRNEHL